MKHRRVKITGLGPITPAGCGREAFLRGMLEPTSQVGLVRLGENGHEIITAAAEVKGFRVGAYALDAGHLRSPRQVQFALAATVLALRDAGLALSDVRKRRPLVMLASSLMAPAKQGKAAAGDAAALELWRAVAGFVGAREDKLSVVSSSSLEAIGRAAERVANGETDLAICGGVETPLSPAILHRLVDAGLSPTHAKDPGRQCRPFDLWRTTGVAGEAACIVVLEAENSPRRAHARVVGWARAADLPNKPWTGLDEALRLALGNAGLRPVAIDCVHTEGNGHKALDAAEAAALVRAFGSRLEVIPTVAVKGTLGNTFGAAGAIQVGCAALSMRHSVLPPAVNWKNPDPDCPLNLSAATRLLATESTLIIDRGLAETVSCLLLQQ